VGENAETFTLLATIAAVNAIPVMELLSDVIVTEESVVAVTGTCVVLIPAGYAF
jgi:hypothetical protein